MACNAQFSPELKWDCLTEIAREIKDGSWKSDPALMIQKVCATLGSAAALMSKNKVSYSKPVLAAASAELAADEATEQRLVRAAEALLVCQKGADTGAGAATFGPGTITAVVQLLMLIQELIRKLS